MIFGHQDNQQQTDATAQNDVAGGGMTFGSSAPATTFTPDTTAPTTAPVADDTNTGVLDQAQTDYLDDMPQGDTSTTPDSSALSQVSDEDIEAEALAAIPPKPEMPSIGKHDNNPPENKPADSAPSMDLSSPSTASDASGDDLLELKQKALGDLGPLVDHLEQTPEEKFRTTMMLIQSTDNQALIKEAYAAANEITDEKAKAQALLDVVNEINYFTQKNAEK